MPVEPARPHLDRQPPQPVITRLDRRLPAWQRRLFRALALCARWLIPPIARAVWRRPPRSRLRRFLYCSVTLITFEAFSSSDFHVPSSFYDPKSELRVDPKQVVLGFEPVYRGRDGLRRFGED
jgi:hypothetical protein